MNKFDLNVYGVVEMDAQHEQEVNGGMCFGFNWGAFWSGCKVGLGIGAGAATAALLA